MAIAGFNFPISGPNAGTNGTDNMVGYITPRDITAGYIMTNQLTAAGVTTFNATSGVNTYTNVTTAATTGGAGVDVFGTTATMSIGDALYIRGDHNASVYGRIYFNVSVAGVGAAWTIRVQRYNSTTDAWENQVITTDTTNAFKTAGLGYIEFTDTVLGIERLQTGETKYAWTKIELLTFTSATTAPKINRCMITYDGMAHLDKTAALNAGTSMGTSYLPRTDTAVMIVGTNTTLGMEIIRAVIDVPAVTYTFEYLRGADNTWQPFTIVHDESSGLTIQSPTAASVRWAMPADWVSATHSGTNVLDGTSFSVTGFLFRWRPTANATSFATTAGTYDVQLDEMAHVHAGNIGLPLKALNVDYLTYDIRGTVSTTDITWTFGNLTTGSVRSFTLPANQRNSAALTNHRLEINPNLVFNEGDELVVKHVAGGNITDFTVVVHYV